MFEEWFSLQGKVALVTGAGRGLGRSIALALAEAGANIVCVGRTKEKIEETARDAEKTGVRALPLVTDVRLSDQVDRSVAQALDAFGRIDVLVNNAGTLLGKASDRTTDTEWHDLIAANLSGSFYYARAVGTHMIGRKTGKIVNVGSIFGWMGTTHCLAYACAKAAVHQMTKNLAVEWGRHGITVNAIVPGYFDTDMPSRILADEKFRKTILDRMPLGRIGRPDEIKPLALYLASSASDFVTGQTFCIDGGYSVALYF